MLRPEIWLPQVENNLKVIKIWDESLCAAKDGSKSEPQPARNWRVNVIDACQASQNKHQDEHLSEKAKRNFKIQSMALGTDMQNCSKWGGSTSSTPNEGVSQSTVLIFPVENEAGLTEGKLLSIYSSLLWRMNLFKRARLRIASSFRSLLHPEGNNLQHIFTIILSPATRQEP